MLSGSKGILYIVPADFTNVAVGDGIGTAPASIALARSAFERRFFATRPAASPIARRSSMKSTTTVMAAISPAFTLFLLELPRLTP